MPTFAPKVPRPAALPVAAPSREARAARAAEVVPDASPAERGFDLSRVPSLPIQRKASIGAIDDAFEREADAVADRVMRMAQPAPLATAPISAAAPGIRRKRACEEDEGRSVRRWRLPASDPAPLDSGLAERVAARHGTALAPQLRAWFEPRFGADFGAVRVHADADAALAARSVRARAYTLGRDIVFGAGEYAPATQAGRHLIAHELAHVVQQRGAARSLQRRAANCPASEPSPQKIITMDDFIALVRRVEASTSTGNDPIATARLIARTKYDGRAWDWMLPSTKGQPGIVAGGQVGADDVGAVCFKLKVLVPDRLGDLIQEGEENGKSWKFTGSLADPMHIVVAVVADAETQAAGTGATGLSRFAGSLPASVSQRSASTWVGDIGKAAGDWMAVRSASGGGGSTKDDHLRDSAPPADLLADIDGVAMTSKAAGNGFVFDRGKKLSDNLQRYYAPVGQTGSSRRFHVFCNVEGFPLESDGVHLTAAAKAAIGQRVKDFADWYTRNDPHVLAYLAAASRSWHFSKALIDRADDWKWFAARFVEYVEKHLAAEGR